MDADKRKSLEYSIQTGIANLLKEEELSNEDSTELFIAFEYEADELRVNMKLYPAKTESQFHLKRTEDGRELEIWR